MSNSSWTKTRKQRDKNKKWKGKEKLLLLTCWIVPTLTQQSSSAANLSLNNNCEMLTDVSTKQKCHHHGSSVALNCLSFSRYLYSLKKNHFYLIKFCFYICISSFFFSLKFEFLYNTSIFIIIMKPVSIFLIFAVLW